jgi:hypothetical protein
MVSPNPIPTQLHQHHIPSSSSMNGNQSMVLSIALTMDTKHILFTKGSCPNSSNEPYPSQHGIYRWKGKTLVGAVWDRPLFCGGTTRESKSDRIYPEFILQDAEWDISFGRIEWDFVSMGKLPRNGTWNSFRPPRHSDRCTWTF